MNLFFSYVKIGRFGTTKDSSTRLPNFFDFMSQKVMGNKLNGTNNLFPWDTLRD